MDEFSLGKKLADRLVRKKLQENSSTSLNPIEGIKNAASSIGDVVSKAYTASGAEAVDEKRKEILDSISNKFAGLTDFKKAATGIADDSYQNMAKNTVGSVMDLAVPSTSDLALGAASKFGKGAGIVANMVKKGGQEIRAGKGITLVETAADKAARKAKDATVTVIPTAADIAAEKAKTSGMRYVPTAQDIVENKLKENPGKVTMSTVRGDTSAVMQKASQVHTPDMPTLDADKKEMLNSWVQEYAKEPKLREMREKNPSEFQRIMRDFIKARTKDLLE